MAVPDNPDVKAADDPYAVEAILRACNVLKAFRGEGEALRLRDLVKRTGLHKATVFRAIRSLVAGSLVERVGKDSYRCRVRVLGGKRVRLGYAAMSENSVFSRDVTDGLRRAAFERNIDLVECDNRYSAKMAVRNAETLVKERVDLAIEVQIHEQVAAVVAATFQAAKIPLIAVDIPHPGGVFFGGNNFAAGRIAGQALGRWARENLGGCIDAVVLLGLSAAGAVPAARMTGAVVGVKEVLAHLTDATLVHLDGKGGYVESLEAMQKYLGHAKVNRTLVAAMNDASALGALRALHECGRADKSAVVGQNATAAGRHEIRVPGTRMIGSVAFFPENYGQHLVRLALDILANKPVPPAVYVKHLLITAENVDKVYPNDAMSSVPSADTLLWRSFH